MMSLATSKPCWHTSLVYRLFVLDALLLAFCLASKGAAWTVAGRPPSALFKVLVLGDNGAGKTALARALCGKGFLAEYTPGTAVSVSARSFSREGHPPAVLEVREVPRVRGRLCRMLGGTL